MHVCIGSLLFSLLGGDNVPLNETSFEGSTPRKTTISTPNVFLGTPFRSPSQSLGSTPSRILTPRIMTPQGGGLGGTPMNSFSDPSTMKQQQSELRAHLKAGLGSLPAPRNDFEIVLPDSEVPSEDVADENRVVEDASEVEEWIAQGKKADGEYVCMHFSFAYLAYVCACMCLLILQLSESGVVNPSQYNVVYLVLLM